MKSKLQLLDELIDDNRKEEVKIEFQLDFYQRELRNPAAMGKPEAAEGMRVRTEYLKNLRRTISQYEEYRKREFPDSK